MVAINVILLFSFTITISNAKRLAEAEENKQQQGDYKVLSSLEIKNKLESFESNFPDFVTLTTSQDLYGLQRAGGENDCPFDNDPGCLNYILTIEDTISHPRKSASYKSLPEVFISGCLHGDERVGPTSAVEAAEVLLHTAECQSLLFKNSTDTKCGEDLKEKYAMDDKTREWLARLVSTRRIIIVPTANALGYFRNVRDEDGIDPNRDFPYDKEPKKCMETIAARTVNEIFRDHMIQMALTFHAGMEVIAYEWGAAPFLSNLSPDDKAQSQISSAYSRFAGSFPGVKNYDVGTMNDKVYYVNGGMEDWAYAASWDHDNVKPCTPNTYGGYDTSKTQYHPGTLRMFNTLVEASDLKTPAAKMVGNRQTLFSNSNGNGGFGNGHLARNVRLSLLMVDIVQPYVSIRAINSKTLHDIIPKQKQTQGILTSQTINIPVTQPTTEITWDVGGSITVDETFIIHTSINQYKPATLNRFIQRLSSSSSSKRQTPTFQFQKSQSYSGVTKWHQDYNSSNEENSSFSTTISLSPHYKNGVIIHAVAKVDQGWINNRMKIKPNLPPQSHVVNSRTNMSWNYDNAGKIIKGKLYWVSEPIVVNIVDNSAI